MAVNQVSLLFYPPRWGQRLTPDATEVTDENVPVLIADSVPSSDGDEPPVWFEAMKEWLTSQGFSIANWGNGRIFERGQTRSMFGLEKEIQVNVGDEAGEVVEVYCRFTLPRGGPPPLASWTMFVTSLCERFGLRLADGDERCDASAFLPAVRESRNYQDFAAAFQWPDVQP